MKTHTESSTFILFYFLTLLLLSCDFNPPAEIEWVDNPNDGRNPDAMPEVLSIEFISKSGPNIPAIIWINTKMATEIRFNKVNRNGDPITASYRPVQSEYQLDLSEGENIIAAQAKALNENESSIKYQSITVKMFEPGTERSFLLGNSGESIVMCWIPAGEFMMGSPEDEDDRLEDEGPVHRITFSEGFWMGKYEVTQGLWEAVMGSNPSHSYGVGDNHPVYDVSWDNIKDFMIALNYTFRLPSESEWEYACRAGTSTRYYWGDDLNYKDIDRYAIYNGNDPGGTAEVGTKESNVWDLHDMSGNVWEWCADWYHGNYNGAPDNGSAWVLPSSRERVFRGACWAYPASGCRSAQRNHNTPNLQHHHLGFRLARDAE